MSLVVFVFCFFGISGKILYIGGIDFKIDTII